jgi:hypothetical protein
MVTLPDSADAGALVRCPWCNADYPLSEALALVPPALIVVSAAELPATPTEASAAAPGLAAESFFIQEPAVAPPAEVAESAAHSAAAKDTATDSRGDFALDFAEHLAETESQSAKADEVETIEDESFQLEGHFVTEDKPPSEIEHETKPAPIGEKGPPQVKPLIKPLPLPRKRKKKGPIRVLGEIILGGGMGLVIAYYGLWWIRGEAAGQFLPRIEWLPGLPPKGYGAKTPTEPTEQQAQPRADKPAIKPEAPTVSQPVAEEKTAAPAIPEPQAAAAPGEKAAPEVAQEKVPLPEQKQPPPPPKIGPRPPAAFDFFALDNALQEATGAFFASGTVDEMNYPALCRLAEVRTYIAADKSSPPQLKTVRDFLDNLVQDSKRVAEIERLGGEALKKANEEAAKKEAGTTAEDEAKPAEDEAKSAGHLGGILLAGKAVSIKSQNGLHGASIKLADGGAPVAVFSAKPFDFIVGDNVLLAGGIIAEPGKNLAGYGGKSRLAIWLGAAIRISAADADKK